MVKWIIGALVVVVVMIFTFTKIDPNVNGSNGNNESDIVSVIEDKINIVIEGQIVHPGSYSMESSATIGDLITTAGGLLSTADEDAFFESAPLEGRDYVYIPAKGQYSDACLIEAEKEKVNINTAGVEELATIDGISLALAQQIVDYRDEHGEFYALEDIKNVSGIGPKTYEKIRDYIKLK